MGTMQVRIKQVNDFTHHQDGTLTPGAMGNSVSAAGEDAPAPKSIQQGKEKGGKAKKGKGKQGAKSAVGDEQAAAQGKDTEQTQKSIQQGRDKGGKGEKGKGKDAEPTQKAVLQGK